MGFSLVYPPPDRLWGSLSLLSKGTGGGGVEADFSVPSSVDFEGVKLHVQSLIHRHGVVFT